MASRSRKTPGSGKPRRLLFTVEVWQDAGSRPHWHLLQTFSDRIGGAPGAHAADKSLAYMTGGIAAAMVRCPAVEALVFGTPS